MWKVNYQESLPLLKKYREASLPSDSPQMHRIRAAAKENSIFVSLGYSEVDLNSLYTTQVMIDPTGNIVSCEECNPISWCRFRARISLSQWQGERCGL